MNQSKHVVVSGAESMGKSSLIHTTLGKLKAEGIVAAGTHEGADMGLPFDPSRFDTDPETYEYAAASSFATMTECELCRRKSANVIHDRSAFDYAAYHRVKHADADFTVMRGVLQATAAFLRRRDSLVVMLTNAKQEAVEPFDDNYRCLDAWWRPQVAPAMRELYAEFGVPVLQIDDAEWSGRAFDAYHAIRHFITGQDKQTHCFAVVEAWLNDHGIESKGMRLVGSQSPNSLRLPDAQSDVDIEVRVESFEDAAAARRSFEGHKSVIGNICKATIDLRFVPESVAPFTD